MRLACAVVVGVWMAAGCAQALGPAGPNQGSNQAASAGPNQAASPGPNQAASPGPNQAASPGSNQTASAGPSQATAEPQGHGPDGIQDHWAGLIQVQRPAQNQPAAQTQMPDLIQIQGAHYYFQDSRCDAAAAVRRICNGKASCTVHADDQLCGEPRPREANALGISYDCGKARKTASGLGGAWVELNCR